MALLGPMVDWATTPATPRKSTVSGSRHSPALPSSRAWADQPSVSAARANASGATAATRADQAPKMPALSRATAAQRALSPIASSPKRIPAKSTPPAALAQPHGAPFLALVAIASSSAAPLRQYLLGALGAGLPAGAQRRQRQVPGEAPAPEPHRPLPGHRAQGHAEADDFGGPARTVAGPHDDAGGPQPAHELGFPGRRHRRSPHQPGKVHPLRLGPAPPSRRLGLGPSRAGEATTATPVDDW